VIEFRLLGVVEIWSHGRLVPAGQPRQRLVLAALLADAGRPVAPETLVQRVWGETPPDRARHAIHEYLGRIRRLLAQLGDPEMPRLARHGAVYVLDCDRDTVDLHRFRRLLEQARLPDCPDETRAERLGQALDLWRGEALADLSGEWVERVRVGGWRQRLDAAVLWARALSRLGRSAEAIEPLAELAAENPLSEPVAAALMRALHATGRSVDALDRYASIRKRLIDDLGTEPGAELQAVLQSVLRAEDPEADRRPLTRAAPATAGPVSRPPPIPAQLPAAVPGFTGREAELARLDAVRAATADQGATVVVCAVSGTAGVGKTALAVHWAHRVAHRYPDGQLYVNLRGFDPTAPPLGPADAIRGFLHALDAPPERLPSGLPAQVALYRSLLANRRMLVLLDNARDAEQVRPLLPGAPGCMVVVTSRNQLASLVALDGASSLQLDVLTTAEAEHLLAHRIGAARTAAEPAAVEGIIGSCARLPLALSIVAASAAVCPTMSLAALAERLRDAGRRLDALSGGDAASDLRTVLSWSFHALSPPAAELFRLLGLHPGPDISAAAASSLAGVPAVAAGHALAELVRANLLTEPVPGRFSLHDLLASYAAELVHSGESEPHRQAALRRLLDHYLHTADAADRLLNPTRDPIPLSPTSSGVAPERFAGLGQAAAWFQAEHRVLLAAVDLAMAAGLDSHTWQLARALTTHLHRERDGEGYAASQRAAVAAAARQGDAAGQVTALHSLARASIMLDRLDEAHQQLQRAQSLSESTGDPLLLAHTCTRLAYLHEVRGRHSGALGQATRALDLFRSAGDRTGQAHALNAVGWYHALLGDYHPALEYCRQAIALHREAGDPDGEAAAWHSLGYAHHHLGQHRQALECYRRALDLLRRVDDRYPQTVILGHAAETHRAAGDPEQASASLRAAVAILDDLAHPDADRVRDQLVRAERAASLELAARAG
jgi:DNA-binding SARP family transcriptional activator/tetratricopeptide (TPR) repeat protein